MARLAEYEARRFYQPEHGHERGTACDYQGRLEPAPGHEADIDRCAMGIREGQGRRRLDQSEEERRRTQTQLTALLTDQREKEKQGPRSFWHWLTGR